VPSFIAIDEQLQLNRGCYFPRRLCFNRTFPFSQINDIWQTTFFWFLLCHINKLEFGSLKHTDYFIGPDNKNILLTFLNTLNEKIHVYTLKSLMPSTGRKFDKDGNMVQWWKNATIEAFHRRNTCIINQYSNVTLEQIGKNVCCNTSHLDGLQLYT